MTPTPESAVTALPADEFLPAHPFGGELDGGIDISINIQDFGPLLKTAAIANISAGAILIPKIVAASQGFQENVTENPGLLKTLIEHPSIVATTTPIAGFAYGLVYGGWRALSSYSRQERQLRGEMGTAIKTFREGNFRKKMEDLTEQATNPRTGQVDEVKLAQLRIANSAFDDGELPRSITRSDILNAAISTGVDEAIEWLDVGVKAGILPSYLILVMKDQVNNALSMSQQGVDALTITENLISTSWEHLWLAILGAGALLFDVKTALKQRANILPSNAIKAG